MNLKVFNNFLNINVILVASVVNVSLYSTVQNRDPFRFIFQEISSLLPLWLDD
jgi:hypothetical protein